MPTVLVVDDSMFARLNICNMLQSAGYDTAEAADGHEGLEMVETARPDCIISDLLMPGLDGIGFLSALRERDLRLPVIVLTADIQETKRRQCLELGAAGFAYKPPQKREILELVDRILTSKEGGR